MKMVLVENAQQTKDLLMENVFVLLDLSQMPKEYVLNVLKSKVPS